MNGSTLVKLSQSNSGSCSFIWEIILIWDIHLCIVVSSLPNCKNAGSNLCDHDKKLQSLLRQLRKEAGFSQQELAAALDKPQSFVSKYESGERKLDILELRQICQKLGIDTVKFVTRLEEALIDEHEA